ncbi:MAG: thermonuclease family protein [Acidimicrobiales bacterium]
MIFRVLTFVVVCGLGIGACADPTARPTEGANAVVATIVDGDTIDVTIAGRSERVRLLGIDTPESVDRDRPVQCYGTEATVRLGELVPVGTSVLLVRDIEPRDRFDRLLAYVFRGDDGLFVNEVMVAEGFADVLVIDPNDAYAADLRQARAAARDGDRGLWGACGGPDVPVDAPE